MNRSAPQHALYQESKSSDIVRMPAVMRMTGLGRSTIYRLIAVRRFPGQVRLADRAVGWRRSELDHWKETRQTVEHPWTRS